MMNRIPVLLAALVLATAALAQPWTNGEVRKVDKAAGKVTLMHGEIKNLNMPAMTMVFTAKDPALLAKLKAGDKVRFTAAQEADKLIVTSIEALR